MTTIVLGATGSIGSEVAQHFQEKQNAVIAVGRNQAKLDSIDYNRGVSKMAVTKRVSDFSMASVDEIFKEALELGPIDAVVSCIGTMGFNSLAKIEAGGLDEAYDVINATLSILKAAATHMQMGSVSLITSIAGSIPIKVQLPIAVASGGIEGLATGAMAELKGKVRVNVLRLGLCRTESTKRFWGNTEKFEQNIAPNYPFGLNSPDHIARTLYNIANTPGMSGQFITMDGGYALK